MGWGGAEKTSSVEGASGERDLTSAKASVVAGTPVGLGSILARRPAFPPPLYLPLLHRGSGVGVADLGAVPACH